MQKYFFTLAVDAHEFVMYLQALKKKIDSLEKKIGMDPQKTDNICEAICELQKHVSEFNSVVQDYKVYLEMAEDLQHIMEEVRSVACFDVSVMFKEVGHHKLIYHASVLTCPAVISLLVGAA